MNYYRIDPRLVRQPVGVGARVQMPIPLDRPRAIKIGDRLVLAGWIDHRQVGLVEALGVVRRVDVENRLLEVALTPVADIELPPNNQGAVHWRTKSVFRFDPALVDRYNLPGRFERHLETLERL